MLQITIPAGELFNEETNEFFTTKETTVRLEHSLVSVSKWESKWHKPFLDKKAKTREETLDYIRCMTLTQNVDPDIYQAIDSATMKKINEYIEDDHTATWFTDRGAKRGNKQVVTSELIYYWMTVHQIPWEAQKWHLGRLMTLIKICNIKNAPPKKMSKSAILRQNKSLNAARSAAMNSKG